MINERKYIKVFDKNHKLLAIFSNDCDGLSVEAQKNLMVAPTINIVSNGESTLEFEMLKTSEKWQQIKNPENIYECNGRRYTALNEGSIVEGAGKVKVTLVETWYNLRHVYSQVHNVDTKIEALDEHTVKILPKTESKFHLTVNGRQYSDNEVRDSRGVLMPRGSAGYALWGILKGTDWRLGICDVLPEGFNAAVDYGTFNVESDMKNALENIQLVQSLYGGILDWDSMNQVLNLRDETKSDSDFNKWKGYTLFEEKNLSEPPVITWDNNLITRLYPLGNGNLNIKRVNGGKSYIDNFTYTDAVYEGYISNPNIYDTNDTGGQITLMNWAKRKLQELCHPRKSIKYSVVDLSGTPEHSFEKFDINDIVRAYYYSPELKKYVYEDLRIQSIGNYNYFFPTAESSIEAGDKIANEVELFYQIYKQSNNAIKPDGNGHISGNDVYMGNNSLPDSFWQVNDKIDKNKEETKKDIIESETSIRQYSDDKYATQELVTRYKKETEDSITTAESTIKQEVSENYVKLSAISTFTKKEPDGKLKLNSASIIQSVNSNTSTTKISASQLNVDFDNYAKKEAVAEISETVTDDSARIGLIVESKSANKYSYSDVKASIIMEAINKNPSTIKISADRINLEGVTTFVRPGDLESGKTVVSGGCITTGTIDASKVTVKNLNASNITSGKITAEYIDASNLNISKLSVDKKVAVDTSSDIIYIGGNDGFKASFNTVHIRANKEIVFGKYVDSYYDRVLVLGTTANELYSTKSDFSIGIINRPISTIYTSTIYIGNTSHWKISHNKIEASGSGFNIGNTVDKIENIYTKNIGDSKNATEKIYTKKLYINGEEFNGSGGSTSFAGREVEMGGNATNYITATTNNELRPNNSNQYATFSLGTSTHYWQYAYIGSNTVEIGKDSSSKIGFFGATPHTQMHVSPLTLESLISVLKSYGLIS